MTRAANPAALASWAGVTYRQIDYWISEGIVTPTCVEGAGKGSGHHRIFVDADYDHAYLTCLLVRHGLAPRIASDVARQLNEGPTAALGMFRITLAGQDVEVAS